MRETMKRKIAFLCGIGLLLSVCAAGCGSSQSADGDAVATVRPTEAGESQDLQGSVAPSATDEGMNEDNGTVDSSDAPSAGQSSTKPDGADDGDVTNGGDVSGDQKPDSSQTSTGEKKISEDDAVRIALDKVKGAKKSDVSIHSEWDDGREIYEGSIIYKEIEYDFEIDATNGKILDWDEESIHDD